MPKPKIAEPAQAVAEPYQPTPQEQTAIAAYRAAKDEKPRRPRATVTWDGKTSAIGLDHPEKAVATALMCKGMGTTDPDFQNELMLQVAAISAKGLKASEGLMNFMLAVIEGLIPSL